MDGNGHVIEWTARTGRGLVLCCDDNHNCKTATLKRRDCDAALQQELEQTNPNTRSRKCPPPAGALTVTFTYGINYGARAARNVTRA